MKSGVAVHLESVAGQQKNYSRVTPSRLNLNDIDPFVRALQFAGAPNLDRMGPNDKQLAITV